MHQISHKVPSNGLAYISEPYTVLHYKLVLGQMEIKLESLLLSVPYSIQINITRCVLYKRKKRLSQMSPKKFSYNDALQYKLDSHA